MPMATQAEPSTSNEEFTPASSHMSTSVCTVTVTVSSPVITSAFVPQM